MSDSQSPLPFSSSKSHLSRSVSELFRRKRGIIERFCGVGDYPFAMTLESPTDSFLPTRRSLLTRLKDWDDQEAWREFFDLYWRLIYSVARRAGLGEAEAQDVVQETLVVVAKQMPGFRYDPARGSFKGWLHTVIRGRLSRHWRKLERAPRRDSEPAIECDTEIDSGETAAPPEFEAIWQSEWEQNLISAALRRVQAKVSPRQYLLFSLATLKEVPTAVIVERYEASRTQIYIAKLRVGRLFKTELERLHRQAT
jgi:RNA polymerase sigma factor (sigma-70 family)